MLTDSQQPHIEFARGDATGIAMPAHAEALRAAGTDFFTAAFQRFGSLNADNRVTRITEFKSFAGGNSGHKVLLSVEYAHTTPGLHTDLFVKFSRDFADVFRDRRRYELEAEVRLATLSRHAEFPVHVPRAYFADFHHESGTGMLITQRIAFGSNGIEPLHPKCMDHQLAEPLTYYRATFTALAKLAAAQQSGRLSPHVDTLFPFAADTAAAEMPIPWNAQQLRERVASYADFAASYPLLLPANITTPHFIARMEHDAMRLLEHAIAIKRFLYANDDFVALCHWNTNIDNAWFWRDADGELRCGLLDWGMVRQMNVATALWGGLCAADLGIWNEHLDELLTLFTTELQMHGGRHLDVAELRLHLQLSVAMLGLALMMDVPALVRARLPQISSNTTPRDPVMHGDPVASGFLHVFTSFLNLWQRHDFGASLDHLLQRLNSK